MHHDAAAQAQVRIGTVGAAATAGGGLLVTPRHLVTCAHVVADACGARRLAFEPAPPDAAIPLDLPLLPRTFATTARVVHWVPMRESDPAHPLGADSNAKAPEDLAVLELAEPLPPDAAPAPLLALESGDYRDLPVHCCGFPAGAEQGA